MEKDGRSAQNSKKVDINVRVYVCIRLIVTRAEKYKVQLGY